VTRRADAPRQSRPGLVIFDCDGVLVDSEPISISALADLVNEAGGRISEDEAFAAFLGLSMESVRDLLRTSYGFDLTDGHRETFRERLNRRFMDELRPVPGVQWAIGRLGCPVCVASSSGLDRIRLALGVTGLLELLEPNLYSASMVERGKPAPDLFLHAARRMGVAPLDCVVVEDSPAGVTAAKAAGMRVIAFTGGRHAARCGLREGLARLAPDDMIDDMRLLPARLGFGSTMVAAGR
jgi:HAD superfamily hydrolase (TIGR01509 family)